MAFSLNFRGNLLDNLKAGQRDLRQAVTDGRHSERVREVMNALESRHDALRYLAVAYHEAVSLESDLEDAKKSLTTLKQVRSAIEAINQSVHFTADSAVYAGAAINAPLERLGYPMVAFHQASVESDGRFTISLEELDGTIDEVTDICANIEAKSVDGLLQVLNLLKQIFPDVTGRLCALRDSLRNIKYDESQSINFESACIEALSVDGKFPTGLTSFLESYAVNAGQMLSVFSEAALSSAASANQFGELLRTLPDGADGDAVINTLCDAIKAVGDPRKAVSSDALAFELPGDGPLFGTPAVDNAGAEDPTAAGDNSDADPTAVDAVATVVTNAQDDPVSGLVAVLTKFTADCTPIAPAAICAQTDPAAGSVEQNQRVLSAANICKGVTALLKVFDMIDVKTWGDANKDIWATARSAFANYKDGVSQLDPRALPALAPMDQPLSDYLDLVYAMSAWPALNYLVNAVKTANAFILFAERSITGESAPVDEAPAEPEEPEETDPAAAPVETDPEADPTAVVAGDDKGDEDDSGDADPSEGEPPLPPEDPTQGSDVPPAENA